MAAKNMAAAFGRIFDAIAENPDERAREIAAKVAAISMSYDFTADQMGCDDALLKLGQARIGLTEEMRRLGDEEPHIIRYDDEDFTRPDVGHLVIPPSP